jgi:hypothetical protein
MKLVERSILLADGDGLGAKPRPDLIAPVLGHLRATLIDSVRMGFLHASRARGRTPGFVNAASDIRFAGHTASADGGTLLRFEVPQFGSVAEEVFRQTQLWEDGPKPDETAFELLGAAISDVGTRRLESNRFDPGLLRRIGSYSRVLNRGVGRIELADVRIPHPVQINDALVRAATELAAATPAARRVRVTGRLDLMGASQGVLKIHLQPGAVVTALWCGSAPVDSLRAFFNRDVVVEGEGVFRPSGSLLRIDADAVAAASQQDEFFRHLPHVAPEHDYVKQARLRPGDKSPYAQVLGRIPGEESDEEFAIAVEEMS